MESVGCVGAITFCRELKNSYSYVYLIGAVGKIMKIGFTTNLDQRLKTLQSQTPLPLEVLNVLPGDMGLEHTLHEEFSCFRFKDEWFVWSHEILQRFKELELSMEIVQAHNSGGIDVAPYFEYLRENNYIPKEKVMVSLGIGVRTLQRYNSFLNSHFPSEYAHPKGTVSYSEKSYQLLKILRDLKLSGATEGTIVEILRRRKDLPQPC